MAVIFKGKAVFLEHPRTGSTAVREALKKIGGQPVTRHSYVKAQRDELTVVVIRNPFDVLVSWWLITGEREGYKTFADFLVRGKDRSLMTVGGKLFYYTQHANVILRYENLAFELGNLLRALKLPQVILPQRNKTPRKMPYRSYYIPETISIVEDLYIGELERYGYSF